MGIRKIMTVKEPCLHKVCRPVEKFDGKLHKLLDDMRETLIEASATAAMAGKSMVDRASLDEALRAAIRNCSVFCWEVFC